MNLKEAFRYQNYLAMLATEATSNMMSRDFTYKTTQQHMKNKACSDDQDETIVVQPATNYGYTPDQLVSFICTVEKEQVSLYQAIDKAKKSCVFVDYDAAISSNKCRQSLINCLRLLVSSKDREVKSRGTGYKFNAEGNQSPYQYDVIETSVAAFSRDNAKALLKQYSAEANDVSTLIDKAAIETIVDFEPIFCVTDSYEDSVELFVNTLHK